MDQDKLGPGLETVVSGTRKIQFASTPTDAGWSAIAARLAGLICIILSTLASADTANFSLVAQLSSDWLYHGTSETDGKPSLGLNAEWQLSDGVFAGIEAHQAEEQGTRQRQRSAMVYVGLGHALSDAWYVTTSLQHREFPGSSKEWDFSKFEVDLLHRSGFGITLDYAPNYYEHDVQAAATQVRYLGILKRKRYWYAQVGALELWDNPWLGDQDYRYAQVGVGGSLGSFSLDIAYHWNSRGDDDDFAGSAFSDPELLVQVVYKLR